MLENTLERIAVAIEKILVHLMVESTQKEAPKTREKKEPAKKETPAPLPATQEPAAPIASVPAAATTQPSPAQPATAPVQQPVAATSVAPAPAVETTPITVEQLRAAIIEVQQKKGPAIAKQIVQTVGNAPQVTKIEVAKYQMVMDACKAALNG